MSWRHVLFNNLWWKLLALALAIMIWSGAQNTEGPLQQLRERTLYDVPIRVLSLPGASRPVRLEPPTVQVDVAGEAPLLRRLGPSSALAYVELPPDRSGEARTNQVQVRLPSGIRLLNLQPDRVIIRAVPLD